MRDWNFFKHCSSLFSELFELFQKSSSVHLRHCLLVAITKNRLQFDAKLKTFAKIPIGALADANFWSFLSSHSAVLSKLKCVLGRIACVEANASDRLQNDAKFAEKLTIFENRSVIDNFRNGMDSKIQQARSIKTSPCMACSVHAPLSYAQFKFFAHFANSQLAFARFERANVLYV